MSAHNQTTTTELGLEVPVKPGEEYREHTAERWRESDRLSYDFCLYLIRTLLIVNRSELERQVTEHREKRDLPGISRNSIIALINDEEEFKPGEIETIIKRSAALLTMESTSKARDLIDKSDSTKDIGAVAMMMTSAHNIKQLSTGGPRRSASIVTGFRLRTLRMRGRSACGMSRRHRMRWWCPQLRCRWSVWRWCRCRK